MWCSPFRRQTWAGRVLVGAAGAALSVAAAASADELHEHVDISPYIVDGQIVTGGYDHASGSAELEVRRVYGVELGEDGLPGNESYANDPGINAVAGSGFGGSILPGLRILGPLSYWDGRGAAVTFTAPAADTQLQLSFGPAQVRTATGTSGTLDPIMLSSTHGHISSLLTDSSGTFNDGITDPAEGIYLLEAQVVASSGSIEASDPIFLVYNFGGEAFETAHEAAIDYAAQTLVPEPTSALLLAAVGGMLLRPGRRRLR